MIASNLARAAQVWMPPKHIMDEIADDLGLSSQRVFFSVKDKYYQALVKFIKENPGLGQLPPEEAPPIPEPYTAPPRPSMEEQYPELAQRIESLTRMLGSSRNE